MTQAQSKLGELFVDIGLSGLGKTIQGLNAVSAGFLLTKNAAAEATKPLREFINGAKDTAVNTSKMTAMLGVTMQEYQKLAMYMKKHNLSEGLLDDMAQMMDKITEFHQRHIGFSQDFQIAANLLGIDFTKFTGDFESIISAFEEILPKLRGMDANQARLITKGLQISPEWIYAALRSDFSLREGLTRTDVSIENYRELSEAQNELSENTKRLTETIVGQLIPPLTSIVKWLNNKVINYENVWENYKQSGRTILKNINPLLVLPSYGFEIIKNKDNIHPSQFFENIVPNENLKSYNGNLEINISNENNIYGTNAEETGEAIASITREDIIDAEFNAYQIANTRIS